MDPAKMQAIWEMQPPADVKVVGRLNWLVNYLSRVQPRLSEIMTPIRKLTHKDVQWSWESEQEEVFAAIKQLITTASVLFYLDSNRPLEVQYDSSQSRLGAVLLQDSKPLDFRSRALTIAEQLYAQTENKMLAMYSQWSDLMTILLEEKRPIYRS